MDALTPQSTALAWRKASRSANNTGQCVEVAGEVSGQPHVLVRDSKISGGTEYPVLRTTKNEWAGLLQSVRNC